MVVEKMTKVRCKLTENYGCKFNKNGICQRKFINLERYEHGQICLKQG